VKILLSYSKVHFDPTKPKKNHRYWSSSTNILARALYELLSEMGDVTYIEGQEYADHAGEVYDLFIGIDRNFSDILKVCKIKASVLWAVNMHPKERNQLISSFAAQEKLPDSAISNWDLIDEQKISQVINNADNILCVGNIATYNSFIENGVPKTKIKMLNYAVGDSDPIESIKETPGNRYIYASSEIGIRKGFDIVYKMFTSSDVQHKDFHLDIMGLPTTPYYEKKLSNLQEKLGKKITCHGWVNSDSTKYQNIMASNDFIVHPALEEGQAGTVLDAARHGVVPIISESTGVDFSPLGWLDSSPDNEHNLFTINSSFNLSSSELKDLKQKTIEYYKLFHEPYLQTMRENLKAIIDGELYPKVSIVLSIYNKGDSILRLLKYLDKAILEYKNVELNIIFDGCKDKSEEIVHRYLRNKNYAITYETTPNIFEVKSNNIGLKKSTGRYCCIVQDDNIIYDRNIFFEAVTFLDKAPKIAILGGLSGVNYYPRGTKLEGPGQIALNENEAYWRQDENTDSDFKHEFFEVDACMRGPLFMRKSFLEEHGYLDEIYAPLYQDDMDIAFRAKSLGYKVFAVLMNVKNESSTIASYSPKRMKFFEDAMKRNTNIFYGRWNPTIKKNYLRMERIEISSFQKERRQDKFQKYLLATRATGKNTFRLPRMVTMKTVRVIHHPSLVGKKFKSLRE